MGRLIFPGVLLMAGYYALFGGEYTVPEMYRFTQDTGAATIALERLRFEVDSLEARAEALETDARTLETVARENFGMIRRGEVLYRFTESADDIEEPGEEL